MLQTRSKHVLGEPTWVDFIATAAAVGIACFLAARVALALISETEGVAVFWPASGVATGILIARGRNACVPVAIGVIVATIAANLMSDRNLWASIAKSGCAAGEVLLTAWLVERWFGERFELDSPRRTFGFLVAAALGAATSAVGGAVAIRLFHTTAPLLDIWRVWFLSAGLGILTVAPLLIGLARMVHDPPQLAETMEGVLALLVLAAASAIGFAAPTDYWVTILPLALLIPLLLWPAARCPPVFAAAAVFILASSVVWTITYGIGRLGDPDVPLANRVHAGQAALFALTLCALVLASLFAERRRHEVALAERDAQLALAGRAALVGSFGYDLDTERMQISEGYVAIHGFPDGTTEIERREWLLGLHPEDRVRLEEVRSHCFRERLDEYDVDYRIVRSKGVRWIDARCFVSYHGDGRPKRVVGVNIDITERKRAEDRHRAMSAELDHRVKNVLATVIAIITQTQGASSSLADFVSGLDHRIRSMARTHELLSQSNWRRIPLVDIVRSEFAPYTIGNVEFSGPRVALQAEAAQVVAMVLHELTTNAAKYGAFSNRGGRVLLQWWWRQNGSGPLAIEWREIGGPPLKPGKPGYGTSIVRELVPYELGGAADLAFTDDGLRCRLDIPDKWISSRLDEDSARLGLVATSAH